MRSDQRVIVKLKAILASRNARIRELEARLGIGPSPRPGATVAEIFEQYQQAFQHARAWVSKRNRLRPLVRRLGSLPASLLTPALWTEHRMARETEVTRYRRPPAPHTLNLEAERAKEMLEWASPWMIEENPLLGIRKEWVDNKRRSRLSREDFERLLLENDRDFDRGPFLRVMLLGSGDCGLRFNEVRTIRLGSAGAPDVRRRANTKGSAPPILTQRTREALNAVVRLTGGPGAGGGVLLNRDTGRLLSEETLRRWLTELFARCSIQAAPGESRLRLDDLRRLAGSLRHMTAEERQRQAVLKDQEALMTERQRVTLSASGALPAGPVLAAELPAQRTQ